MTLEQLDCFLKEQGYIKISSSIPEINFFFREENMHANVLQVIDYKLGAYVTQEQYKDLKKKVNEFFHGIGVKELHMLTLPVCEEGIKADMLCSGDPFCWLIDPIENRLIIYEDQVADFYGMKDLLENFLQEISITSDGSQDLSASAKPVEVLSWKQRLMQMQWMNLLLVSINVILFIICTFTGDLLYNKGAFSVQNLLQDGEWYRVLTSMFLHWDIEHLVSNMLVLYYIGNVVEKQIGHLPYVIIYFLSGISGAIFSMGYEMFTHSYISSVGASGAVFGIEGALLMLVLLHRGKWADMTAGKVVFTILFSLYCGFTSSFVNNAAHIGGVLMGFLATGIFWLLIPEIRSNQKRGNLFL